jgi:sec-independent protein translocase protein TatA
MHLGFGELLLIFIVVVLVFGSSKLPQLGDALGRGIKNFKRTINEPDAIDVTPKTDADPAIKPPAAGVPVTKPSATAPKK